MRSSTQVLPLSCTKDMVQEGSSEPETSTEIAEGSLEAWWISLKCPGPIQHRTPWKGTMLKGNESSSNHPVSKKNWWLEDKFPMNFRLFSGADVTIVVFRECSPLNKFTLLKMCPKYLGCFYMMNSEFHPKNPQKISPPSETPDWFHAFGFLLPLLLDQVHEIWRPRTQGLVPGDFRRLADSVVSPNQTERLNWNSNSFVLCFGKKIRIQHIHNNNNNNNNNNKKKNELSIWRQQNDFHIQPPGFFNKNL